jgi:AAA domain/Caspase domain
VTRVNRRKALLIGIENHDDTRFGPLPSTQADIWQLRQVLEDRSIGAFVSVQCESDLTADDMRYHIGEFLESCEPDELALLYVSGHGTRLVQAGGEFCFVAKDTDFDRVAETGVSAGFVNERLEACWAPQKIALIDCCRSGGFAVGLRTSDRGDGPAAKSGEEALLRSHGVYVLSSSRAGEDSMAGAVTADGAEPSAFTAEVVEALRTGRAARDGSGQVSVDDLFHHVVKRMRAINPGQVPVKCALGVDDVIRIASCPQGPARQLLPYVRRPAAPGSTAAQHPPPGTPAKNARPTWPALLDYYRECVLSENADTPLMAVGDEGGSYVCLTGSERHLSGDVDDDNGTAVPPEAAALIRKAAEDDAELWAGYPAVVLNGPRHGRPWKEPRFAPLLIRRIEVVQDGDEVRLMPYGPVLPHPRLARDRLGEEEAVRLAETYHPSWHAGQHDRMAVDVRHLLRQEYELPCVQEPAPDRLADRIDIRTPGDGARNAAVLFLAPRDTATTKNLLADLGSLAQKSAQIRATALAALSPDPAERAAAISDRAPEPPRLATPLPSNEAQSAVLRSAMTRRLTVATGPPGTGKSQLVANLVATAVAAGQSVLVASTNNEAVDEVWKRCEQLCPGSVVRTGRASGEPNYREVEADSLRALSAAEPPGRTVQTAGMDVDVAGERRARARALLAATAAGDRTLRLAGEARETHADTLGHSVRDLTRLMEHTDDVAALARRLTRLAQARFLGELRRRNALRRLGFAAPREGGTAAVCAALAGFAAAEQTWRTARAQAARQPGDTELRAGLETAEAAVRAASLTLLDSAVRSAARAGQRRITALLQARTAGGGDWAAVRNVLPAVRGWAVTSLTARRFPPDPALFDLVVVDEASQCAIPHVLPLLFRARRALVIGDPMQLAHISTTSPEREQAIRRAAGLRSHWLERHRLAHRRHSAFHAAERAAGGTLLLDEHFRCHPDIAAISNRLFYDGRLTVLTDVRDRPGLERDAVIWAHVPGRAVRGPSGGSWTNHEEAAKVEASVRHLLEVLPAGTGATIGVVTPFKAQADLLRRKLRPYADRVRTGTVHTFQGGERDVMVFSLVAGEGMHPGALGWVEGQLNLWNVAITRARSHLIVVGDADLWQRRRGIGPALAAAAGSADGPGGGTDTPEPLRRLYKALSDHPGASVELGTRIHGHPADAVLRTDGRTLAVLLDPGPDEDADPARHLRLTLHRRDLLADPANGTTALRVPSWWLHDTGAPGGTALENALHGPAPTTS